MLPVVSLFAGVIISALMQLIKLYTRDNYLLTLCITILLASIGGVGLWYLQTMGLWEAFLSVFTSVAVVYQFITKPIEKTLAALKK